MLNLEMRNVENKIVLEDSLTRFTTNASNNIINANFLTDNYLYYYGYYGCIPIHLKVPIVSDIVATNAQVIYINERNAGCGFFLDTQCSVPIMLNNVIRSCSDELCTAYFKCDLKSQLVQLNYMFGNGVIAQFEIRVQSYCSYTGFDLLGYTVSNVCINISFYIDQLFKFNDGCDDDLYKSIVLKNINSGLLYSDFTCSNIVLMGSTLGKRDIYVSAPLDVSFGILGDINAKATLILSDENSINIEYHTSDKCILIPLSIRVGNNFLIEQVIMDYISNIDTICSFFFDKNCSNRLNYENGLSKDSMGNYNVYFSCDNRDMKAEIRYIYGASDKIIGSGTASVFSVLSCDIMGINISENIVAGSCFSLNFHLHHLFKNIPERCPVFNDFSKIVLKSLSGDIYSDSLCSVSVNVGDVLGNEIWYTKNTLSSSFILKNFPNIESTLSILSTSKNSIIYNSCIPVFLDVPKIVDVSSTHVQIKYKSNTSSRCDFFFNDICTLGLVINSNVGCLGDRCGIYFKCNDKSGITVGLDYTFSDGDKVMGARSIEIKASNLCQLYSRDISLYSVYDACLNINTFLNSLFFFIPIDGCVLPSVYLINSDYPIYKDSSCYNIVEKNSILNNDMWYVKRAVHGTFGLLNYPASKAKITVDDLSEILVPYNSSQMCKLISVPIYSVKLGNEVIYSDAFVVKMIRNIDLSCNFFSDLSCLSDLHAGDRIKNCIEGQCKSYFKCDNRVNTAILDYEFVSTEIIGAARILVESKLYCSPKVIPVINGYISSDFCSDIRFFLINMFKNSPENLCPAFSISDILLSGKTLGEVFSDPACTIPLLNSEIISGSAYAKDSIVATFAPAQYPNIIASISLDGVQATEIFHYVSQLCTEILIKTSSVRVGDAYIIADYLIPYAIYGTNEGCGFFINPDCSGPLLVNDGFINDCNDIECRLYFMCDTLSMQLEIYYTLIEQENFDSPIGSGGLIITTDLLYNNLGNDDKFLVIDII